jgi:UTP--glucose-1-phosphate uridylyltransferase
VIAIVEIPFTQVERYGVISGDLIDGTNDTYRVTNMFEKPKLDDLIEFVEDRVNPNNVPSFMAIVGRYILTPDIFDVLKKIKPDKNEEIQITDALFSQARQGKVIAYKFKGKRFDCGSIKGYLEATNHFAKKLGINNI